jgi:hypothetical protein
VTEPTIHRDYGPNGKKHVEPGVPDALPKATFGHRAVSFTSGDHYPEIPFENNFAERQIRPAVILRKNSQSNRSDRAAVTQAVRMSIDRTLRLRGQDPLNTIAAALRTYLQTGHLLPLPTPITANG